MTIRFVCYIVSYTSNEPLKAVRACNWISLHYKINPATVGKGFNLLVEEGILYKRRGVGMFVTKGAKEQLLRKRKNLFFDRYIKTMLEEAHRLCISKEELMHMIEEGSDHERD